MTDTVDACPECDTTSAIYKRHAAKPHGRNTAGDPTWVCRECGATFETPTTRDRKHDGDTRKGLAGRLSRASPEEVADD